MADEKPDTRPQQPSLPPELPDDEATRLQGDLSRTKGMAPITETPTPKPAPKATQEARRTVLPPPPPPPRPSTRPVADKPKRGQPLPPVPMPTRQQPSALSLPIWSVGLTLMLVCGAVSCIVLGVVSLGGRTVPAGSPRFVILTAEIPTNTPFVPDSLIPTAIPNQLAQSGTIPAFSLQGPTLPPVVISPTPENIAVGKNVIATAEDSGVNVRSAAGIQNEILFVAENGEAFTIIEGPIQADGLTWWKIQSPTDPNRAGWAAAAYLELPITATLAP